jgi:hypothetical protein
VIESWSLNTLTFVNASSFYPSMSPDGLLVRVHSRNSGRERLPSAPLSLSRETDTILGQGTIPEPSTPHIGKGVALVAQTASFVYIYARISQIAEMTLSFHVTFTNSAGNHSGSSSHLYSTVFLLCTTRCFCSSGTSPTFARRSSHVL